MIPMSLDDVARILGAACDRRTGTLVIRRVTTDSRDVRPGDVFFALKGANFDGNRFAAEALANGAIACVCDDKLAASVSPDRILHVDDALIALGRLAQHYRKTVLPAHTVVIAVTGSNGKTTTKCMIDHVLSMEFKGRAAPKSFNNAIGVPLTLLSAEESDRYLVVEIGTNAPGEIAALAAMASPNVCVITSIGEAHLEGLGDIHAVAAEKTSLLRSVRPAGFAVVNIDRPEILPYLGNGSLRLLTFGEDPSARLCVTRRRADLFGTAFELEGRYLIELPMPGAHHATNAAAAFAVARWFGVAPSRIVDRLRSFHPPEGRTELQEVGGVKVVDDAYNANPSSVRAAVETLRSARNGRRVLVLGDMLELGPDSAASHARVFRAAMDAGIEVLVAVGHSTVEAARANVSDRNGTQVYCCEDLTAANVVLDDLITAGDTVWIKGSRGMQLDRVVRHLRGRLGKAEPQTSACTTVHAG